MAVSQSHPEDGATAAKLHTAPAVPCVCREARCDRADLPRIANVTRLRTDRKRAGLRVRKNMLASPTLKDWDPLAVLALNVWLLE